MRLEMTRTVSVTPAGNPGPDNNKESLPQRGTWVISDVNPGVTTDIVTSHTSSNTSIYKVKCTLVSSYCFIGADHLIRGGLRFFFMIKLFSTPSLNIQFFLDLI